jgi:hypothetical protein
MSLLRVGPILGVVLLTGCLSTTKIAPPRVVGPDAPAPAADPAAQMSKFEMFLTHQGLSSEPAKLGQAARLTAAWNNKIIYAPDPTHGGAPVPGILARIYVFGPDEAVPLDPDGELVVGVWDMSAKETGEQPRLMELWHIDAQSAQKFKKQDFLGLGYSLFLPWSKYHVDLKQVNVVARYNSADGRCLVSSPETLTIDHSATLQRAADKIGATKLDGKRDLLEVLPKVEPRPLGTDLTLPQPRNGK